MRNEKSFIWEILDYLHQLFFPKKEELSGKLFVSGRGALEFKFRHYVKNVFVYFSDENLPVPCNPCDPGKDDELDWCVVYRDGHYILIISWDVSSQQIIKWKIYDGHLALKS